MSKTFGRIAAGMAKLTTLPLNRWRRAMALAHASEAMQPSWRIDTSAGPIVFSGPSGRALHDAHGYNKEEPETVAWVEGLPKDAVFWDIGANVGLYSILAAKRGLTVIAFEPAASTMAVLVRNIQANAVDRKVSAYAIALSEHTELNHLHMARDRLSAGHAVHSFGTDDTVAGKIDDSVLQAAIGFSGDDFVAQFGAPPPTHVKLDVDGLEAAILRGMRALMGGHVRELMVEIYDDMNPAQSKDIRETIAALGFVEAPTAFPDGRNKLFKRA
jgi:FkbM family methyltransferase